MGTHEILLVDDDRLILSTLASGLERAGYRVSTAADGEEALQRVAEQLPELAILDVRMPQMAGTTVAERFQELGIPFLALTAYNERETVELMTARGALGYLVKPIDVPQLVPAIEAALKRATDMADMREHSDNLSRALAADRDTSIAIGILMERLRMTSEQAFEHLRQAARSERRKLKDVAREIVQAQDLLNRLSVR